MQELTEIMVTVPVWMLVATGLAGVVVSMIAFVLAESISCKRLQIKTRQTDAGVKKVKVEIEPELEPEPDILAVLPVATRIEKEPLPVSSGAGKGFPAIRQHYWYYVGKSRFATLREALVATGYAVPENWKPDWKKVPAEGRARIKRVKLEDAARVVPVADASTSASLEKPVVAPVATGVPDKPSYKRTSVSSGGTVMTVTKKK